MKIKTPSFTRLILSICLPLTAGLTTARGQLNVGTTLPPDASAMLQVSSTSQGFRLPQVNLTSTTIFGLNAPTVASQAYGMMVYNNNVSISGSTAYPAFGAGLYKWDGLGWISSSKTPIILVTGNGTVSLNVANNTPSADLDFGTIAIHTSDITVTGNNTVQFITSGTYKIDVSCLANITTNNTTNTGIEELIVMQNSGILDLGVFSVAPVSAGTGTTVGANYLIQYSTIATFSSGDTMALKGQDSGLAAYMSNYKLLSLQLSRVQ